MRKFLFALVLMSLIASAAIDQSYDMTVNRDGSSVIVKSMELNIFGADLNAAALGDVAELCDKDSRLSCSVEGKTITIAKEFSPGGYYTYRSEYGLLEIEHTLTISRIPTDRFSTALEDLLDEAGVLEASGESADPIDLLDREANDESITVLKQFGANLSYYISVPAGMTEAKAGAVEGQRVGDAVRFDLVDVMDAGQPITVKSKELNSPNIIVISMVIVLAALALTFARTKPKKRRKK
jgi:hypothetical protein